MVELRYLGHSFFHIKGSNSSILIDPIFDSTKTDLKRKRSLPIKKDSLKKISMILLTNETPEHFDKAAVEQLALKQGAVVIAPDSILRELNIPKTQKKPTFSNYELSFKGVKVKSTTAHFPKSFYPLGYLIDCDGLSIYHAGVTSLLDSFGEINTDVALLPISSRSMDVVDAVRATKLIKPKKVIPMQFDIFEDRRTDPNDFKKRIEDSVLKTETIILSPGQKIIL